MRAWRLKAFTKKLKMGLIKFEKEESPGKQKLQEALKQLGKVMEKYIQNCIDNRGAVDNFKRGVVPMLGYYISHESHHRGNILLTMKHSGFKLPDSLKWGIWEWNKKEVLDGVEAITFTKYGMQYSNYYPQLEIAAFFRFTGRANFPTFHTNLSICFSLC